LIEELAAEEGSFFYLLHEKGRAISDVEFEPDAVFILGDHLGLPRNEEKFVERFAHEKVSLGTTSYLASQCITVLHYELDTRKNR